MYKFDKLIGNSVIFCRIEQNLLLFETLDARQDIGAIKQK